MRSFKSTLRPRLPPLPISLIKFQNHSFIYNNSIYFLRFLPWKASELTLNANEREKETPPPTPRGTASTGSTHYDTSSAPTSAPSRSVSGTSSPVNSTPTPNLAAPIGKLLVKVDEARGIRDSRDPYFVCTFESNEFISKGAKREEEESNSNSQPMAAPSRGPGGITIPMRSRQSPGASGKIENGITHPSWGYEAML